MTDLNEKYREIVSDLSRSRVFSHLTKEKLEQIASLGTPRNFSQGSTILQEGLENHYIYLILKGSVSVYSGGKLVARYGRTGDVFGEMSIVTGQPTTATVIANEDMETLEIDGAFIGGFKWEQDSELVAVFYKLFCLSLLDKLKLTTLKARLFEDAIRHAPLNDLSQPDDLSERTVQQNLENTLLTSLGIHTADQAIVVADAQGRVVRINRVAESLFQLIEVQVFRKPMKTLCEEKSYSNIYPKLIKGEISSWTGELEFVKADGRNFPGGASLSVIQDQQGAQIGILSIINDLTKQKLLEKELAQAKKMEAVAQLASGVAHHFNNLLHIIGGYTHLISQYSRDIPDLGKMTERIKNAVNRGASLTERVYAFGGKQVLQPDVIQLGEILAEATGLAQRHLGADIVIETVVTDELWETSVDKSRLEDAILKLSLNACDAMNNEGKLTIRAKNESLDENYCKAQPEATPGDFVMLSVSDTGCGMSPELLERALEPFYTTKNIAEHEGLGLSMVYGFVKQSGGHVEIESEPGSGTSIKPFLPRTKTS